MAGDAQQRTSGTGRASVRRGRSWLAVTVVCSVLLVACGGTASSPSASSPSAAPATAAVTSASPTEAANTLHLVVIGDSIGHADFCSDCTGWVELYATQLETSLGRPVVVANRSRNDSAGIPQIKTQVAEDESLRKEIAEADFVVVSVGFNSAMPDASTGTGCTGDMGTTDASYAAWLLTTDDTCLQAGIDAWAPDYDEIFSTIVGLRPDAPTLRVAFNVYDGNIDWIQNADVPQDQVPLIEAWLTKFYDRWNAMHCDRAKAAGFTCLDIYHAFSGTGENRSLRDLTVDGAHPNQPGSDLIASMLAKLDTSTIAP